MVTLAWTCAIVAAMAGILLLAHSVWKLVQTRRRRGRACTGCGYPRPSGTSSPPRCPECGTEYDKKRSASRLVASCVLGTVRLVIACALFVPLATLLQPYRAARVLEPIFVTWVEASRHELGVGVFVQEEMGFRTQWLARGAGALQRFNVYVGIDAGSLQRARVLDRSGREAFSTEGRAIAIGSPYAPTPGALAAAHEFGDVDSSTDIDGDGVPDVLVSTFSGGAHCCWGYAVISLSDPPRVTFELASEVGARFQLEPTAQGNATIIETADTTWSYWKACYACSPRPGVVMRLWRGQTTIVASAMRQAAPSADELAAEAARVRDQLRIDLGDGGKDFSTAEYWDMPLRLMYSGHEELAWKFFEDAWPDGVAGKEEFLREFRETLERSPYWARVRAAFAEASPSNLDGAINP